MKQGRGARAEGREKGLTTRGADEVWKFDRRGVLRAARQIPSPNFDDRPAGAGIELLVIHSISLPPGQFASDGVIDFFTNRLDPTAHPYYREIADLQVSSHFFIRRGGDLIQFVPCGKRAWHAGQSEWCGRSRCNDFSVGVELEGADDVPFTDAQYQALARLAGALKAAYPLADCVGHADIARPAGRKTDPGPNFDWARFRKSIQT